MPSTSTLEMRDRPPEHRGATGLARDATRSSTPGRGAAPARDVREGGRWTRAQRAKNAAIASLIRAALRVSDLVPAAGLLVAGRWLGRAAAHLSPALRDRARRRAERCLPPDRASRVARRCFERAGEHLAVTLLLRRERVRASDWVHVPAGARAALADALAHGRGAIVVSAHLGPFEHLAAVVAELGWSPAVVVRESYDPALDPVVDHHRRLRGLTVIHRGKPGAAFRLIRALRGGRPVGLLPDLGGRVASVPVTFLGEQRMLPVGPAELARATGAPVLVGTLQRRAAARSGPRFELSFSAVATDARSSQELTQRIIAELERRILAHPDDWLWMAGP